MELYVHELDKDVLVVAVDGGLNAQTAEQFTQEVDKVASRGFSKIIVDCSALAYISSSGIGALLLLHRRMKARGADVKVAGARSFVLDVLRVARLDGLFDMYPDVSRARLEFRPEDEAGAGPEDIATRKSRLRTRLKLALTAMPAARRAADSARLVDHMLKMPEWDAAKGVLLFWPRVDVEDRPSNAEPDIRPLIEAGLAAGKMVALPRVDWASTSMHAARVQTIPDDLEVDGHNPASGLWQPRAACPTMDLGTIDFVLVPGLGFDTHGRRIGRGAGFYDRLLGQLSAQAKPLRVGVCFDGQLERDLPIEDHDQTMDVVATPTGILRTGESTARPEPQTP